MAINLRKGQRTGIDRSVRMVKIGLGWDPAVGIHQNYDLDLSAFVCDENGKAPSDNEFVFYFNKNWGNDAIYHTGDDDDGNHSSGGDDEQIFIDFQRIPSWVSKIVIAVTIYEAQKKHQNFGQVTNAYVDVVKVSNRKDIHGETIIHFDLGEEFSTETALLVSEIYRQNGQWRFDAIGAGYRCSLSAFCRMYGVVVGDSPD